MSEVVAAAAAAKAGLVRVVNVDFVAWVLVIMFVKKWEDKKLKSENVGPLFFVRLYPKVPFSWICHRDSDLCLSAACRNIYFEEKK